MGMGELDNPSPKITEILADDLGLEFAEEHSINCGNARTGDSRRRKWPLGSWSLHAARDEVRKALIPTSKAYVNELRDWFMAALNNRPLFVEMVLIENLNDQQDDIDACIDLFQGVPQEIRINLLPMNFIGRPDLKPSPPERVCIFEIVCANAAIFVADSKAERKKIARLRTLAVVG